VHDVKGGDDVVGRRQPCFRVEDFVADPVRASALLLRFAFEARLARVLLIALYRDVEARLDDQLSEVVSALEANATLITLGGLSRISGRRLRPSAGPRRYRQPAAASCCLGSPKPCWTAGPLTARNHLCAKRCAWPGSPVRPGSWRRRPC